MNIIATLEQIRSSFSDLADWHDEEAASPELDNDLFTLGYALGVATAYDRAAWRIQEVIDGLRDEEK